MPSPKPPHQPKRTTLQLVGAGDLPDGRGPSVPVGGGNAVPAPAAAKVVTHEQLLARRAEARAQGRKLVQCHGCFDIVHPGHLRHLRYARAQGDLLLVTITGDSMISKGSGRPLIPQELRAENLAALDCVDLVYIEPRPTAAELLGEVRPDVYVKGREYERNQDPRFKAEQEIVMRHGGRVVFSSGDVVFSSTALIAALEQS
ncbi:MAG: adenylyltransferase/cytidyltransferase family protein, partial [Phycisphaerales bacterium]|nr:adenylyltransferase/cytidyltransferase family protein [Phycisphaerales bacterium]